MDVNEVKSHLNTAKAEIERAESLVRAAREALQTAEQTVLLVRATHADPLGLPQIHYMNEELERSLVHGVHARASIDGFMPLL